MSIQAHVETRGVGGSVGTAGFSSAPSPEEGGQRAARATSAGPHKPRWRIFTITEGSAELSEVLKPRREGNEFVYVEDYLRGTTEAGLEEGEAGGGETCQGF